jgi:hypothetical protein
MEFVQGQEARRENSGTYSRHLSTFSRRRDTVIGKIPFIGRDDKKKGGCGQQLFRILLLFMLEYLG